MANNYKKKFLDILSDDTFGICPAPISAQSAINVLVEYLLGEDWYTSLPASVDQVNTVIVDSILRKYSKDYKKDLKNISCSLDKR